MANMVNFIIYYNKNWDKREGAEDSYKRREGKKEGRKGGVDDRKCPG
jgi:hypothetical protein